MAKSRRRTPKQARAQVTRAAVLEAATQILEREGEARFTTNHIAERAGVSIGTLYQYFSRKEDILIALAREEMERLYRKNAKIAGRADDPMQATRLALRAFINAFRDRPATRRAALKAVLTAESPTALGAEVDRSSMILPAWRGMSRLDAFVLTRAVMGVVRAGVLEDHPDLYTRKFENRLMRMIEGYQQAT